MTPTLDENFWNSVGGATLSPEEREDIEDEFTDRLALALMNELSKEQFEQFEPIADTPDAQNWLRANIPAYDEIVKDAVESIREEYEKPATA